MVMVVVVVMVMVMVVVLWANEAPAVKKFTAHGFS